MHASKGIILLVVAACMLVLIHATASAATDNSATITAPQKSIPGAVGSGPAAILQIEARGPVSDMSQSQAALQQMVAASGAEKVVGDYRVDVILAPPRGWYMPRDGQLVWRPPARNENQHIEAVVLDSLTGKPIPVTPTLDVLNGQGRVIQSQRLMYLWHPQADHYGANFSIPTAGTYAIRVRAPAPPIFRHSRELGNRFTQPLDVTFTGVPITPMGPPPGEAGPGTPATMGGAGVVTPGTAGSACPPGTTR